MQQPMDLGQLIHLVDLDMLAAEGSPLDLEEVHVYLSDPSTCEEIQILKPNPALQNNFTR